MLKWFKPPQVVDPYERIVYTSMHYGLLLFFGFSLSLLLTPRVPLQLALISASVLSSLCSYIILHKFHLNLAGMIFLLSVWILITLGVLSLNGVHNSVAYIYVILIVYSSLFLRLPKLLLGFTMLSILVIVLLVISEMVGGPFPLAQKEYLFWDRVVMLIGVFASVGILINITTHSLRKSLAQVLESEKALKVRNQELETLSEIYKSSEERYRILFDNAGVMATVYDEEGYVRLANSLSAKRFNASETEVIGKKISELVTNINDDDFKKLVRLVLETGETRTISGDQLLPDGRSIDSLSQVIPLPKKDDELGEVLILTSDITELNQTEKQKEALRLAEERIGFFTDFFGTVSHDIKTPLTIMKTHLYLLERLAEGPDRDEKLVQLNQQVDILEQYIQDMLMVSKLEHIPTVHRQKVDVKGLVEEVIERLQLRFEDKGIRYTYQASEPMLVMEADRDQLRRALLNLVENAIHYTPLAGRIEIRTYSNEDQQIHIEVQDTGIGIAEIDLPHVFEAFYRSAEAKKRVSNGTGLGLAIVKKIVDLHEGEVSVRRVPEGGSCFMLVLPLV
ncbi:hypothetical protein MASR2M15_18310 [Anaerolineales bacterium]